MTFVFLGIILLLLWTTRYYRERALYHRACKDVQVAETLRVAESAREAQAESARLAQMVRDGEAAYAGLLESLKVGGLVRAPTDQELEAGEW